LKTRRKSRRRLAQSSNENIRALAGEPCNRRIATTTFVLARDLRIVLHGTTTAVHVVHNFDVVNDATGLIVRQRQIGSIFSRFELHLYVIKIRISSGAEINLGALDLGVGIEDGRDASELLVCDAAQGRVLDRWGGLKRELGRC
jgi:hypothetical protein